MKKILSVIMVIALMAMSAVALADGNMQNGMPGGMPPQGQMGGPMMGGPNGGNRPEGQMPNGQAPSGERPSGAPDLPSGEKPAMIDFDDMVTKGVISQETCDKIKTYMEAHKPAGMPGMNGQAPTGEKMENLPEINGEQSVVGKTPPELPDGEKPEGTPEMNGQAPEVSAMGGLLKDLLAAEVITQTEYDALIAAQTVEAA